MCENQSREPTRKCTAMCGETKPVSDFPRGRKVCSSCTTLLQRKRYQDESEANQREANRRFFEIIRWPMPALLRKNIHG